MPGETRLNDIPYLEYRVINEVLHEAGRCAGAITSTMKSAELGLKSLMILYSIRGWHDLLTHRVMAIAKSSSIFDDLLNALKSQHESRSAGYFQLAHRLLSSIQALSPEANAWGLALGPSL